MDTLLHSNNRRIATLRGTLLVAFFFLLVSLMIETFLSNPPAENMTTLTPIYSLGILVISVFLALVLPRRRSLFLGLIIGGSFANFLASVFSSPVADYWLIPGSADHYFNLPDLGIILGPVLYSLFALRELWDIEISYRRQGEALKR